jgi:hypothetical protein
MPSGKKKVLDQARLKIAKEKAALSSSPQATRLATAIKKLAADSDVLVQFRIKDLEGPAMAKCHCICFA